MMFILNNIDKSIDYCIELLKAQEYSKVIGTSHKVILTSLSELTRNGGTDTSELIHNFKKKYATEPKLCEELIKYIDYINQSYTKSPSYSLAENCLEMLKYFYLKLNEYVDNCLSSLSAEQKERYFSLKEHIQVNNLKTPLSVL